MTFPLELKDAGVILNHMLRTEKVDEEVVEKAMKFYPAEEFKSPTEQISQMMLDSGAWIGHGVSVKCACPPPSVWLQSHRIRHEARSAGSKARS